jgi:hypothetical protein
LHIPHFQAGDIDCIAFDLVVATDKYMLQELKSVAISTIRRKPFLRLRH